MMKETETMYSKRVSTLDGIVWEDEDYFFFQAEDGIRDKLVTGVQTCALPISDLGKTWERRDTGIGDKEIYSLATQVVNRSEERRVGKECRSRWSVYH